MLSSLVILAVQVAFHSFYVSLFLATLVRFWVLVPSCLCQGQLELRVISLWIWQGQKGSVVSGIRARVKDRFTEKFSES